MVINGTLMLEDDVIASITDNVVKTIDADRCPLSIKDNGYIEKWLDSRKFDGSRTNLRIIKRLFKISALDDYEIIMRVHAASITDRYWIKHVDENIKYSDVLFDKDLLFSAALSGDSSALLTPDFIKSPEFTNIGSLEKGWKKQPEGWFLYKNETILEMFNECFCEKISELLNIKTAHYEVDGDYLRSPDFTEAGLYSLEHIYSIVEHNTDDYLFVYDKLYEQYGQEIAYQYVELMYFDALVRNVDRHAFNFGLIRDISTGEAISLAPNFDFNNTLFIKGMSKNSLGATDILINDFIDLINKRNIQFTSIDLTQEIVCNATNMLAASPFYNDAVNLVTRRFRTLRSLIRSSISVTKNGSTDN